MSYPVYREKAKKNLTTTLKTILSSPYHGQQQPAVVQVEKKSIISKCNVNIYTESNGPCTSGLQDNGRQAVNVRATAEAAVVDCGVEEDAEMTLHVTAAGKLTESPTELMEDGERSGERR